MLASLATGGAWAQTTEMPPVAADTPVQEIEVIPALDLESPDARVSYAIGWDIANGFIRRRLEDLVPLAYVHGTKDALTDAAPAMSEHQIERLTAELWGRGRDRRREASEERFEQNRQSATRFLEENREKEGVHVRPSGLQYEVLQAGTGDSPGAGDTVVVHYRGWLLDGTEFDSSHRWGRPATLRLNATIPAWRETLPLMKEGARWKLFVPPELGYGERGAHRTIGPNALLIFELELLQVK
jgi:FKBP-type peptidyl-prolyl cis-trans isomerase